ncbi:response regulator transcription factor [Congregibacter brevis]|uniref:Response regulator transcription factor n=1 Tax=Congregibacter brevis TaxID=3081201 RepID=A0ABZ0IGE1_9GAMM|nr:response regulator transcription factor [Congregibacter sp. IMCC45268]
MSHARYRCIVVDDELLGRELIESHLDQLPQFEVVGSCGSAIEAGELLSKVKVDLLFLDIQMPVLKGTDFYQSLSNPPSVIFTTAYRDYALDGFELEAVDYLLKPITFPRFFKAVGRFLAVQRDNGHSDFNPEDVTKNSVFIRANRKDVRLLLADIYYVQGLKDYVRIHTKDSVYTVKETMTSLTERLGNGFVRVHRSYVVNQHRVTAITHTDVEVGDMEIPIGETYRDAAFQSLGNAR